ncbi:HAD family phosphatase [Stenotrophomonas sp. CD2]|nr:HAD family phosphatase [Stenotrophomonas sp. CD2]
MSRFPFDAVLFDCDGVLVDSEPLVARVLSEMLTERGWPLTPAQAGEVFLGQSVAHLAGLIEERTGKPFTEEWLEEFRQQRNRALERDLVAIQGAPEAVRAIGAATGGRIACASGADLHKVKLQLGKVGILDAFGAHVFSGRHAAHQAASGCLSGRRRSAGRGPEALRGDRGYRDRCNGWRGSRSHRIRLQ